MLPQLYEYQKTHYLKIEKIIKENNFAFDLSVMGTGKSIIALHIIKNLFKDKKVIIISMPMIIKKTWHDLNMKYNLGAELITINKLIRDNNKLLIRNGKSYELSECMKDFNGLIIVDEMHMAKNNTLTAKSIKTLIKPSEQKKVLLMTGTLIDNLSQINHYMDIINYKSMTESEFLGDFMTKYCSKMSTINTNYIVENIFHEISDNRDKNKAVVFYNYALKYLNNTTNKVVIAVFHINLIEILGKMFGSSAKIIIGSTPDKKRIKYINKFQEPNLSSRILIANATIIGQGLNLDDENGNFPRICLLSPNYYAINTTQLYMRFCRVNTKSMSHIKIIG